jgi:hypothetical protein
MRTLYIILSFICLSACAINNKQMINNKDAPGMRGQSADVLTERWGKPSLVGQAANGNKVYAYITESSNNAPSNSPAAVVLSGKTIGGSGSSGKSLTKLKCTSLFEINKQNIIVGAKNHGNC